MIIYCCLILWSGGTASFVFAAGPNRHVEALVFNCYTCHWLDDKRPHSRKHLNTLTADKIIRKLEEFRQGKGNPTIMDRITAALSKEDIRAIAAYISTSKQE
ncbi:MAG: c-type cytochrome [Gammaproteobacteria bacterium]